MCNNEHNKKNCSQRSLIMGDRRTQKTKKAIRAAFLELIKEKAIHRITVAELSRQADLGRGTFYLHYQDIYDLSEQIEDEFFDELGEIYDASFPESAPPDLSLLAETLTKYIASNEDIFLLLTNADNGGLALRKLNALLNEKILKNAMPDTLSNYDTMETVFIISGVIGVLEEWVQDGMKIPQNEISTILHQILMKLWI